MENFATLLKEARKRANLTQIELAHQVGIDHSYISKLERGTDPPARDKALAIANALELSKVEQAYLLLAAGCANTTDLEGLNGDEEQEGQHVVTLPFGFGAFYFPETNDLEEKIIIEEIRRLIRRPELSPEQRKEYMQLIHSFLSWLEFRIKKE